MAISDVADEFFTLESRIASFQTAQPISKRRASNASSKAPKSLKWPHKFLSAEELAKAGFFYYPTQGNPDNVACFLCHKALDGWEEDDDPLAEHLKHSSECGWAIVATIEKQDGDLSQEYPTSVRMIEARKATFSDKWPHETKKGWKCKTKQMVDSGWKYTPTMECDDMATCTYCSLMLDGWEPSDKPLEEHFKRSPECPFFTLVNSYKQSPAVKRTKSKRERASKASRLSTQSAFTVASEAPSITDIPAGDDDSILTTATNATTKKMGKVKKAPAGKGRKTRAKKGEPVEVPAPEPEDADFEVKVDLEPQPTRGKKRKSEDDHESIVPTIEMTPPPPKRRATRTRGSMAVDESIVEHSDIIQPEVSKPAGRKGRTSRRSTRKASVASVASLRAPAIDDEEIDRALEADLERRLSDDEMETTASAVPKKSSRTTKAVKADHAMFGMNPVEGDDAAIEAELDAMDIEAKPLPKAKGAKVKQPRKPSAKQQAAAKKAAEAEAQARQLAEEDEASQQIVMELEHSISMQQSSPVIQQKKQRTSSKQPTKPMSRATRGSAMSINDNVSAIGDYMELNDDHHNDDSGHETDASVASQSTIVRGGPSRRGSTLKKGRGGKKASTRNIEEIVQKLQAPIPSIEVPERATSAKGKKVIPIEEISKVEEVFYNPLPEAPQPTALEPSAKVIKAKVAKPRGRPPKVTSEASQPIATFEESVAVGEAPPAQSKIVPQKTKPVPEVRSPTPAPMEATPSQSPQSSDAENHPPSSKPSAAMKKTATPHSTAKRIPLAPTTPSLSPSRRNVITGLQSLHPWTAVDLEAIFLKSPGGENVIGHVADFLGGTVDKIKNGDLTSPEKRMTVEEWIHHNAQMAEEKLKNECERMVGKFESEGTRAMRALEGVECVE
ncbi:BIR-domain-containing protein [Hyaloscypha variabilis F]|uniref:BIR-domain-containing protein n=1 Tax=Hyaloscypha variabilis (strain UAMH 11265 / GT02V1 / F) TaxID=1149755 RepID=A0A2J6S9P8_HYAVF|nr:BIR-domain-containing protein [Hyaloscypha variabilis F]